MPALASQDVAATFRSQADKCHAVADVKIPRWDPAFKIPSLRKAKMEMPKTYMELVTLQEVLDSISNHMSVGHNSKEKLEIMKTTLKIQFNNYEISWENSCGYLSSEAVFDEFQELYSIADEAVNKANKALFKSRMFLSENSWATAEATAIADSEAKATAEATAFADSEAKAAAVETKFPANNVKLNVECDVTPEARTPDAVSPTAGGSEVVTPDAGAHCVPDRHILAPAAGGSEVVTLDARTSDAGTTDSKTSDTKMLGARAPLSEGTQGSPDIDHPNSSEGQGQPQRPPRPLEPGENSEGTHPSRAPLSNSWEPQRPPRPLEPGENSMAVPPFAGETEAVL